MSHDHDHNHHGPQNLSHINRAFYIGIALNSLYTLVEFVLGYLNNSLALIADATHNLSDVASLIISLIGLKLAEKAARTAYTYGFKKASIFASMINAILLIVVVINIFSEAIERLSSPPEVGGTIIIYTALIGVAINSISAMLFYKGQKNDINVKGAFIHLLVDAIVSVGVVISGVLINYTGLNIIDPVISVIIAIVIMISTWGLFKESLKLMLDGIPKNINVMEVKQKVEDLPEVKNIHHIHVWGLSSTVNALTAHVILNGVFTMSEQINIKKQIKHVLEQEDIQHTTIEFDGQEGCTSPNC